MAATHSIGMLLNHTLRAPSSANKANYASRDVQLKTALALRHVAAVIGMELFATKTTRKTRVHYGPGRPRLFRTFNVQICTPQASADIILLPPHNTGFRPGLGESPYAI
jgi:hypothetical protein